ncbi:MAG TPA: hypothetical protein VIC56_05040 [Gemmatimonadota bacterium]|jgi:hypothetical protein
MTLELFVEQLQKLYGDALQAVAVYGSTVAGERIPKRSDTNVLVVVERLELELLRGEGAIARGWAEAGNPPPITLTAEEWRGSADVFPMEYADILESHRVVHGRLPVEGLAVDREHLRLQTENQALGKLVQLRRGILAAGGSRRDLVELLAASFSTWMVIFRAVARLHGERPPSDYDALTRLVAERAGFDGTPFLRVAAHLRGTPLPQGEVDGVLAGWLDAGKRLSRHVNALADGG